MNKEPTDESLDNLLEFLRHHLSNQPEVLAEAATLLNEYLFHAFSDIRNGSIEKVRRKLAPKDKEILKSIQVPAEMPA